MASFRERGSSFARRTTTMTNSWVRKKSAQQGDVDTMNQSAEVKMSRVDSHDPQAGTGLGTVIENPILARRSAATNSRGAAGGEAAEKGAGASTGDHGEGGGGGVVDIDVGASDDYFDVELGDDVIQVEEVTIDDDEETPARHQGTVRTHMCGLLPGLASRPRGAEL